MLLRLQLVAVSEAVVVASAVGVAVSAAVVAASAAVVAASAAVVAASAVVVAASAAVVAASAAVVAASAAVVVAAHAAVLAASAAVFAGSAAERPEVGIVHWDVERWLRRQERVLRWLLRKLTQHGGLHSETPVKEISMPLTVCPDLVVGNVELLRLQLSLLRLQLW